LRLEPARAIVARERPYAAEEEEMLRLFEGDYIKLTDEQIRLLRELEKGEQSISGNNNRDGLTRLIKEKYITEQSTNISTVLYTITDTGRAALHANQKVTR
jgi:hypothetical protein